jgi:hypothetical protein
VVLHVCDERAFFGCNHYLINLIDLSSDNNASSKTGAVVSVQIANNGVVSRPLSDILEVHNMCLERCVFV